MKKISIIGRGTVGCLAVSHFLRFTNYNVEWIFDPSILPAPVGEGTTLDFPIHLHNNLNFTSTDLDNINSTPKLGIWKRGWGKGKEFYHPFIAGSVGLHFSAVEFQDYVYKKLINHPRLQVIEDNVTNYNSLDSDHIMVCTGSPKSLDKEFTEYKSIPVNSAMVFQCPWEFPKFNHSITFAKKYGWVFGIPLKNRCAIGYVYNKDFCSEEDIQEDVQSILSEFKLQPVLTRKINFQNYSRKQNFNDRICYNGNASFFLEPLEATSTHLALTINQMAIDLWHLKTFTYEQLNTHYNTMVDDIESMICLHYFSGSVYKSKFWDYAMELADSKISKKLSYNNNFKLIVDSLYNSNIIDSNMQVGTWGPRNYRLNIQELGLFDKLKNKVLDL